MTILHSFLSDLPTTWISGISCTISRSCTVKISMMFRVIQGSGAWRSEALWVMSPSTSAQCADRNQAKAHLAHPARSTTVACGTSAALSFRISSRIASRCLSKSRRLTLFVKMSAVFFAPGTLNNWLTRLEASAAWIQRHPASQVTDSTTTTPLANCQCS